MDNLYTVLYTFPKVLTRRICVAIKSFFSWWSCEGGDGGEGWGSVSCDTKQAWPDHDDDDECEKKLNASFSQGLSN